MKELSSRTARSGAKNLAMCAVMAALLVVSQIALSFAAGIEVVTLLLCAFCVAFGPIYGLITALAFCLLRILVWGVGNLAVQALYLTYFPIFSVVIGFYGRLINRLTDGEKVEQTEKNSLKRRLNGKTCLALVGLVVIVGLLTCCFTLLDDVITPAITGLGESSTKLYFYQSLPTLGIHVTCATLSVAVLFFPIYLVLRKFSR